SPTYREVSSSLFLREGCAPGWVTDLRYRSSPPPTWAQPLRQGYSRFSPVRNYPMNFPRAGGKFREGTPAVVWLSQLDTRGRRVLGKFPPQNAKTLIAMTEGASSTDGEQPSLPPKTRADPIGRGLLLISRKGHTLHPTREIIPRAGCLCQPSHVLL